MSTYTFDSKQVGRFSVAVEYDEDGYSMNPREDTDCNLVEFALTHRRYSLPNELCLAFDHLDTVEEVEQAVRDLVGDDLAWIGRVAGHDHGDLELSFADSHDRWDGGFAGYGVIRRSTLRKVGFDWERISPKRRAFLREAAEAELRRYSDWAKGEVYYYAILDEDGSCVESCHGYIGDEDARYAMTVAVAEAERLEADAAEADLEAAETDREIEAVASRITFVPVLDNLGIAV